MLCVMVRLAAVVALGMSALAFADIAPRRPPAPPPPECRADAECTITTFDGCCGSCCPRQPYAMNRQRLDALEASCAVKKCARPDCSDVACAMVVPEPASSFRAVCEAGRCVARRVSEVAECRRDADCTVVSGLPPPGSACHAQPCGCCPVNVAAPVDRARPRPAPPGPMPTPAPAKKGAGPAFGLSTGDGRPQGPTVTPPACSPCPQPPPANAACVAGQCTLAPVRPRPPPPG